MTTFADADSNQYRIADLEFFYVGNNLILTYAKSRKSFCLLKSGIVELLKTCREFRTIDEHIQTYCSGWQVNTAMKGIMRQELHKLAQGDYLISRSSILAGLQGQINSPSSNQITCIGFPTCERVEILRRGLSSYIENCQHFDRTCNFVVVDDSPLPETRAAYREMLQNLRCRYGVSIAYAGLEEKLAFAEKLSKVGQIPLDAVLFACVGDKEYGITTVGANRNALLLHTVGECIFSADDDTICQIAAVPEAQMQELFFSSGDHPVETWLFPNRESLLRSVHFVEQDLLALHERWLGKYPCIGTTTSEYGYEVEFKQAEPHFLKQLKEGQVKIRVTMNGVVGDCRWDNPDQYLFLRGASFHRLTESEEIYRSVRTTREVLEAVQSVTITERANPLFATYIGLDNQEFLPPFMPLGRAEDVAFGTILTKCFGTSYAVQLPWVLYHAPSETKAFPSMRSMFSVGFNTWIAACIGLFEPGFTHEPAERLRKLGQHLKQMGSLSKASFEEFVRLHTWYTMSSVVLELEEWIQNKEKPLPAFLLQDVRSLVTRIQTSASIPITNLYALNGGSETLQHLLVQFGQMLEYWPTMWEAARHLRIEGQRLAQPL